MNSEWKYLQYKDVISIIVESICSLISVARTYPQYRGLKFALGFRNKPSSRHRIIALLCDSHNNTRVHNLSKHTKKPEGRPLLRKTQCHFHGSLCRESCGMVAPYIQHHQFLIFLFIPAGSCTPSIQTSHLPYWESISTELKLQDGRKLPESASHN